MKELYTGDGIDLIPQGKKAVSFVFSNLEDGSDVKLDDVQLYYSEERSNVHKQTVYIALVDIGVDLTELTVDHFTITDGEVQSILFGNSDGIGDLNAQDALNIVATWLRKGADPDDQGILIMNVNADSRIGTGDAIAVVDRFVGGKEFAVVGR